MSLVSYEVWRKNSICDCFRSNYASRRKKVGKFRKWVVKIRSLNLVWNLEVATETRNMLKGESEEGNEGGCKERSASCYEFKKISSNYLLWRLFWATSSLPSTRN